MATMHTPLMENMDKVMKTMLDDSDRYRGEVLTCDGKGLLCCCCQTVIPDGQKDYEVMGKPVCESCINDVDVAWEQVDRLWKALTRLQEDINAVVGQ